MKKIGTIGLAVILAVLAWFGTANAVVIDFEKNTMTTEKGDNPWNIARELWSKGSLNPLIMETFGITNPKRLPVGKTAIIPKVEKIEINATNRAPFGAGAIRGSEKILKIIDETRYTQVEKNCLKESVIEDNPVKDTIKKGERFDYQTDKYGLYGPGNFVYGSDTEAMRWHRECQTAWVKIICDQVVAGECGNWNPRCIEEPMRPAPPEEKIQKPELKSEAPKKIVEIPKEKKVEEFTYYEIPCPKCKDLEVMAGVAMWVHSPGENESNKGSHYWLEALYWENLEKDCSSEYWGGIGGIGSFYHYKADHLPSKGKGWRAAGEVGLKRFYLSDMDENGTELERSWQLKARFGWEESKWENPDTSQKIRQRGPVYGEYGEYIHELIDEKLYLVIQEELWLGFNQKISGPKEWNLSPQSRTYFASFLGIDWKFASNLTLRIGPGYNYQGWDKENVFAPQAQIMWDIPNKGGRLAAGLYGNFYSHLGPTLGILGRYENPYLLKEKYGKARVAQWKYTGVGINNQTSITENNKEGGEKEVILQSEEKSSVDIKELKESPVETTMF